MSEQAPNVIPQAIELPRSSGVLLHITSLPEGRLGAGAYEFVDWLADAGQSWWQVLPLGPPDCYGSPYASHSAFACWKQLLASPRARVSAAQIADFKERNAYWISGWEAFAGKGAVADQVRFEREWSALRDYGAARGVRLLGDIAIYVANDSSEHQAHPELFQSGWVAGAPPDNFSPTGQMWGNPLYDWEVLAREGYRFWVQRMRRAFAMFDLVRIDHFRGLAGYWAIPEGAPDARSGGWRPGPGRALFEAIASELPGPMPLVAEDLGLITPDVEALRDELRLPGMVVLQYGFDPYDLSNPHRPYNHAENRVVYTGTHDNNTARGWYEALRDDARSFFESECAARNIHDPEPWWRMIAMAMCSHSRVAMVQAQDILGLGCEAQMNKPGQAEGQWRWQMSAGALTAEHAARLRAATQSTGRLPAGS